MQQKGRASSRRSQRTRTHFKEAFAALVCENGYNRVTVTDIVERAQYNRATFYLHYRDKQQLTEELRQEMYDGIKRASHDRYVRGREIKVSTMETTSFDLFYYIYQQQQFFNIYACPDPIPGIHDDLPRAIYEILEEYFIFRGSGSVNINDSTFKLYMAHGTAGLILSWIRQGYQTSPESLTRQIIDILRSFAESFSVVKI